MTRDPRLERYLSTLESSLKPFPVSDRAEIITEIKSHVMAALERDPQANVESILAALGEPEIVANRYLLERGLKPSKPPISPVVRWMVIGFLGTFAMVLLFAGFVIAQFSPIVKVDEAQNKVELLGGIIKVDGENDRVSIKSFGVSEFDGMYAGTEVLRSGQTVEIRFKNGRVEVKSTDDSALKFECRGSRERTSGNDVWNGDSTLDLSSLGDNVRCEVAVPSTAKLRIEGENGKLEIEDADWETEATLARGELSFTTKRGRQFKYDVKVDSGAADTFESSTAPDARLVRLHVGSGRISKD